MNYIVSCSTCGHQSIIELASPEEISQAKCPICHVGEALVMVSSVEKYLPSPEEIAEALGLDC